MKNDIQQQKFYFTKNTFHQIPGAGNIIAAYNETTYKAFNKVKKRKNAYWQISNKLRIKPLINVKIR